MVLDTRRYQVQCSMSSHDMASNKTPCKWCKSTSRPTSTCIQCSNMSFCDKCWSKYDPHKPGRFGYDGKPHEKSNAEVLIRVRDILEPKGIAKEHEDQLQQDDDTTWFGIERDSSNHATFQDYGRFATLMGESKTPGLNDGHRYPQLVSFIGQTGAGKSTIIKMLISRRVSNEPVRSPVTSSSDNDRVPTTGDVHLYADPLSFRSRIPMLYADCEGLDGGEGVPKGLRHRLLSETTTMANVSLRSPNHSDGDPSEGPVNLAAQMSNAQINPSIKTRKKLQKSRYSSTRNIAWADVPERQKRGYAVLELYPRLLYTFSDVVVYVLRNARTFESTMLEKLLEWGQSSIDKSVNQPTLPHAVIVINATDKVNEKEWDVDEGTRMFLNDVKDAIDEDPRLNKYANCPGSDIPRYMLIDTQISNLFGVIQARCKASLMAKKQSHMLADAETLQRYLQAAYGHFTQNLHKPFDFVEEALKHSPISRDFGGNILKLALSIKEGCSRTQGSTRLVFDQLADMIAHCIFLDSVRQGLMDNTRKHSDDAYIGFCRDALETYLELYSPCKYEHPKYGRCCNCKNTHSAKGHQNSRGKLIGSGPYEPDLDSSQYEPSWIGNIQKCLTKLQLAFDKSYPKSPNQSLAINHLQFVDSFYGTLGDANLFTSNTACFCCLQGLPEHPLPCGHILCRQCVEAHATHFPRKLLLKSCPLHTTKTLWESNFTITVPPKFSGLRVLSLDGGGIRGIVELQALKAIEKELGSGLLIQHFLDLIVGTSTGGIIALGLGVRKWSVDDCISQFKALCIKAFQPRELVGIPVLQNLAVLNHGSMYKTRPLKDILQSSFESKPLFGDTGQDAMAPIKVAITSATSIDQHAIVFANYNRRDPGEYDLPYEFHRPELPSLEIKVWEAARATSAAPPFFKLFTKEETLATYMDGAFYHNNPVRVAHHELRLLSDKKPPDILISLGTGMNAEIKEKSDKPAAREVKGQSLKSLYRVVVERFDYLLHCNRIWNDFMAEMGVADSNSSGSKYNLHRRMLRINPDLKSKVPRLDDKSQVDAIENATREYMRSIPDEIREIANKLVASTFFFARESIEQAHDICDKIGHLCCRFEDGSDEMKGLGHFLLRCARGNFLPYFIIQDDEDETYPIKFTNNTLTDMETRGVFILERIDLRLSAENSTTQISLVLQSDTYPHLDNTHIPISGFPRRLVSEDNESKVSAIKPPQPGEQSVNTAPEAQGPQPAVVRRGIGRRTMRKLDTLRRSSSSFFKSSLRRPPAQGRPSDDSARTRPSEDNMYLSPAEDGQGRHSEASSEERFLAQLEA
ncbi:uncharacterized protein PG998_006401 [Apiospora kogelbergensis]|uniref:uncharacterized protein n=1 Tax=Apiospora kogelbergensis TaxID=1337665 RepID=UPI00312E9B08